MDTKTEQLTMTVEEAGQLLGISRKSAYRAAANGELPTVRFGRRLVVPRAQLLRLLGHATDSPDADARSGHRVARR